MRELGKPLSQKGTGQRVKKLPGEIITELTVNIKKELKDKKVVKTTKQTGLISKSELAKKLNISDRTLRSYKKYFASLENENIKLNKNDRRPANEKEFLKKFSKTVDQINKELPRKKRIAKTREKGTKYDVGQIENIRPLISKPLFNRLKKELDKKETYGFHIRVNVLFITKDGDYNEWITFVPPIKTSPGLKKYNELNKWLNMEIEKNFTSRQNIYSYRHNVIGFEILEVILVPTLNLPVK